MSDTDRRKVQIEASLDATGVREGAADAVAAAKGMAAGVEEAGRRAASGFKPMESSAASAGASLGREEKRIVSSMQRLEAATKAGGRETAAYFENIAKSRGLDVAALQPYINSLRQAEEAQKRLSQSGDFVMSDRARAAALRGVPAQFTDILVSLQGGQNPLTVILQQGGQLKDMFGGAGDAAKALGGYVLGLVNPLTLAAAAAGALAYGYYSGAKEAQAFLVVLTKTGNQAGTSVQQLVDMSAAMDNVAGITQAKAAEALVTFAANAGVGAERLQRYTTTAIEWERATGQSVEEVAKDFKKLGEDPVKAVLELNKQMDFLTSATFEQIKTLQEVGRETDAARVAQDAYDSAIAGATSTITANLGVVEKSWIAIRNVGAEVIDMIKSLGRQEGMHAVVERLQKAVNDYQDRGPLNSVTESTGSYANGLKTRQNKLDKAREMLGLSESANTYAQGSREREQALISLSAEASKHYDKQTQKRLALAAAEKKYGEAAKTSAEAQNQYDLVVAGINKKYEEKGGKGANTAPAARRLDLSEIQNAAREEVRVIDGQQKDLERLRQSGLIDDQGYYSQKRSLIEESSKVEETALQEQISRLQQEKVKGADALAVKKQIADTESKLTAKRLENGEKLKALSFEESLALERQRMNLEALAASHQRAMEQMLIQQQRTVSAAWMGSKDRQRAENLWGIEDSYLAERRRLEDRRMFTPNLSVEMRQEIDQRLAYLEIEKTERIRVAKATYAELDQLQTQWELGAGFAMQNYVDQAANVAQQTADAFSNAFRGMEDALVKFVTTGKLSFTDLANNIVADITRIIIKQQLSNALGVAGTGGNAGSGLMGLLGQGLGLLTGAPSVGNAGWGDYSAEGLAAAFGAVPNALGGVYDSQSLSAYRNQIHDTPQIFAFAKGAGVFGEAGPEAIMPLTRAPDGNLGVRALSSATGGPTNINVTVQMPQGASRETALQFGRTVSRQIAIAQARNG